MKFFNNPGRKVSRRGSKRRGKVTRKSRRVRRKTARVHSTGGSMARRKSSRKGKRRSSRRRKSAAGSGVQLRRRGITVYRGNPRRRRRSGGFRSNPSGTIIATIKQGVKDGAVILVAQVITKKAFDVIAPRIPLPGLAGTIVAGLGIPSIIAIAGRKFVPSQSRLITASAFAEGVRRILAATPVGPFLSDVVNAGDQSQEYSAWPQPQIPANMGAYPGMSGVEDEVYVQ